MIKAFDTASVLVGHAHDIVRTGYGAVGVYIRDDRTPVAEVRALASVGLQLFSVQEKGQPTAVTYFTVQQAKIDAHRALAWLMRVGAPAGSIHAFACDYDPAHDEVDGPIAEYWSWVHGILKPEGYLVGAYGSGLLLRRLIELGFCNPDGSWLAQSTGWDGYQAFNALAAIVQGPTTMISLGTGRYQVDLCTVVNERVLWSPEGF